MKIQIQRKQVSRPEGGLALRVTHKEHGTRSRKSGPCYNIRCGCCSEKVQIFYDREDWGLEINGVNGSLENWRDILLPLLCIERKDGEFIDVSPRAKTARKKLEEMRKRFLGDCAIGIV